MFTKSLYYAHSAQDKLGNLLPYEHRQTLQSHLVNVGEMAAEFAQVFGAQEIACQTGQLHDVGKYSEDFNHRLHGGPPVDHATAGAKIAVERWGGVIGKLIAFCIAGHHAGLANGNGEGDNCRTLKQRLALKFGEDIPILDNLWQQEIKPLKTCLHRHSKPTRIILFSPTPSSPECSIPAWWMPIISIPKRFIQT